MKPKRRTDRQATRGPAAAWMGLLPVVSAYVRSLVRDYHDSEDVIQNIAVVFANKFGSLDPSRELMPWVLRIARYEVVNYIRSREKAVCRYDNEALACIERAYLSIHDETETMKTSLHTCIQQLHSRPRRVLELRYFRDMAIDEIGRQVGISSNAVYVMLCRVRAALAKCVQEKTKTTWTLS